MTTQKTIAWHCLPNESPADRAMRLNKELHRIFFENREICLPASLYHYNDGSVFCHMCEGYAKLEQTFKHGTPRFLESPEAMQLIVESGRFAEVREEYFHWNPSGAKYLCRVLLYRRGNPNMDYSFRAAGNSRQEAFYVAALRSLGYL